MTTIDFTEWTDAQLAVGLDFPNSPHYDALTKEIARRTREGVPDDGSKERVAAFAATLAPKRRRTRR